MSAVWNSVWLETNSTSLVASGMPPTEMGGTCLSVLISSAAEVIQIEISSLNAPRGRCSIRMHTFEPVKERDPAPEAIWSGMRLIYDSASCSRTSRAHSKTCDSIWQLQVLRHLCSWETSYSGEGRALDIPYNQEKRHYPHFYGRGVQTSNAGIGSTSMSTIHKGNISFLYHQKKHHMEHRDNVRARLYSVLGSTSVHCLVFSLARIY
jgi:hypothetical protein